jgi:hypothetical protein
MTASVIATITLSLATLAKPGPLAPAAEIVLEESGRLEYFAACGNLVVATVGVASSALYQIDLAKRHAAKTSTLTVTAHTFAFSSDCRWLATGEVSHKVNTATLWRLSPEGVAAKACDLGTNRYPVERIAFSEDGAWIAISTNLGDAQLWSVDREKASARRTFAAAVVAHDASDSLMSLAFGGDLLLAGALNGSVRLLELDRKKGVLTVKSTLIGNDANRRDKGWLDLKSGEVEMPFGGRIWSVALVHGARQALALSESGTLLAWGLDKEGKAGERRTLVGKLVEPSRLAVSPDGKRFAIVGGPGAVWTMNPTAGAAAPLRSLEGLDEVGGHPATEGAAFMPGGELLVGAFNTARLKLYLLE